MLSSPAERQIVQNSLLGTIPALGKEWIVTLDFFPLNYDYRDWTTVLRLTTGGDYEKYGDRTPIVQIHPNFGMIFASAVNSQNNYYQIFKDFKTHLPVIGHWTTLEISQIKGRDGKFMFSAAVGGAQVFSVENTDPASFENVKVYASGHWRYPAQPGKIRFLTIKSNL